VSAFTPDALSAYAWNGRRLEFYRCTTCGCILYHERAKKVGEGTRVGVNARMMDPRDIAGVRVRKLDGASTWRYLD
jgi:hypothetical protein